MFHCPDCGKDSEFALVDGYPVGDRLLEGVMFEVRQTPDGFEVKPTADAEKYFRHIHANSAEWCEEVKKYVEETKEVDCALCGASDILEH